MLAFKKKKTNRIVVLDKYNWPIEKQTSKNQYRNYIYFITYIMRCLIHGRKITTNAKWVEMQYNKFSNGTQENVPGCKQ